MELSKTNKVLGIIYFILIVILSYFLSRAILDYTIKTITKSIKIITITSYEAINSMILIYFYCLAVLLVPLIYFICYSYVKDALYMKERKLILKAKYLYICLLLGATYGYYSAINYLIPFLYTFNDKIKVSNTLSLENLIITTIKNCLLFSIISLTPFIIKLTLDYDLIKKEFYSGNRKYIYIVILLLSAFLTPPDALSMIITAIPFAMLFEIGLLISRKNNSLIANSFTD